MFKDKAVPHILSAHAPITCLSAARGPRTVRSMVGLQHYSEQSCSRCTVSASINVEVFCIYLPVTLVSAGQLETTCGGLLTLLLLTLRRLIGVAPDESVAPRFGGGGGGEGGGGGGPVACGSGGDMLMTLAI